MKGLGASKGQISQLIFNFDLFHGNLLEILTVTSNIFFENGKW